MVAHGPAIVAQEFKLLLKNALILLHNYHVELEKDVFGFMEFVLEIMQVDIIHAINITFYNVLKALDAV